MYFYKSLFYIPNSSYTYSNSQEGHLYLSNHFICCQCFTTIYQLRYTVSQIPLNIPTNQPTFHWSSSPVIFLHWIDFSVPKSYHIYISLLDRSIYIFQLLQITLILPFLLNFSYIIFLLHPMRQVEEEGHINQNQVSRETHLRFCSLIMLQCVYILRWFYSLKFISSNRITWPRWDRPYCGLPLCDSCPVRRGEIIPLCP